MSTSSVGFPTTYSDVLDRLLDQLEKQASEDPTDGRADRRHRVNAPVTLGVVPGDDVTQAADITRFRALHRGWATDLSHAGIGLLTEHALPANMMMHVNVETMLGQPAVLPFRVVYCNQLMPHTYRIGGMFIFTD